MNRACPTDRRGPALIFPGDPTSPFIGPIIEIRLFRFRFVLFPFFNKTTEKTRRRSRSSSVSSSFLFFFFFFSFLSFARAFSFSLKGDAIFVSALSRDNFRLCISLEDWWTRARRCPTSDEAYVGIYASILPCEFILESTCSTNDRKSEPPVGGGFLELLHVCPARIPRFWLKERQEATKS